MTVALSPRQRELIVCVAASGGRLVHWHGGYWTVPGVAMTRPETGPYEEMPIWHTSAETLYACEVRGLVEREGGVAHGRPLPAWADGRRLTALGWDLAKELA